MATPSTQKPLVIITGAAGNLGQILAQALGNEYRIIGLDRSTAESVHANYTVDVTSADSVNDAFEQLAREHGRHTAAVIHLAAYFDFTGKESPLYQKVNVDGTRHLLSALQDFSVDRFIYSSTMLVHKPGEPGIKINESTPIAPGWAYPKSKAAVEKLIEQEAGKIPYTLLRLAGVYDEQIAVPTLGHQIARIYERDLKANLYAGDPEAGQSFLHKDDMIDAFKRTLERRNQLPAAHALLIGEDQCLSYQALQNRIGELIHGENEWRTLSIPESIAKAGAWVEEKTEPLVPDAFDKGEKPFIRPFMIDMASDHYDLDISAARAQLDWQPTRSLYATLTTMIKNLKADAAGWYAANKITPPDWLEEAEEKGRNPHRLLEIYEKQYRRDHRANLWGAFLNTGLGGWLITAPPAMNYAGTAMAYSDTIAGCVLIILGFFSLSRRNGWARWAISLVGIWLLFAPLAFWTPNAAAYLNGTIVGILAIGFSVGLRPTPGVSPIAATTGPTIPPGWTRNPSSWPQRIPIIILAFVGFFISRYLTAYQLGHIEGVWDPFFNAPDGGVKNGTESIITSSMSEAWPVPDAGLGAMVYALEILVGLIGSAQRWRTMPWLVTLFGVMIVPLGIVSITFIIIQPIVLGTWCTLCLIGAAAMLLQIPYSLDELLATGQFLKRRHREGKPVLKIFFTGDTDEGDSKNEVDEFDQGLGQLMQETFVGALGLPWNLALCILLGLWLMFTRITLDHDGSMANWDHLVGALVITAAICALAEVSRSARFLIIPFAAPLLITAVLYAPNTQSMVITLISAVALIASSLPKGKISSRFGNFKP